MSVSSVGASGPHNVTQLQRQLKKDQQALAADQRAHAGQKALELDQMKVQTDQGLINAASESAQRAAAAPAAPAKQASTEKSAIADDGSRYL